MTKEELERECWFYNTATQPSTDGIECDACGNKSYVKVIIGNYTQIIPCEKCHNKRRMKRLIEQSNLGSLYDVYTFDAFQTREPFQSALKGLAERYTNTLDHKTQWLFVSGQVGSGKTHICTAVARALLEKGYEVYYMLWRDEISRLKSDVNSEEYQRAMRRLSTVDVLYIDDFFKVKTMPTDADFQIMFQIINNRYIRKLTTIFSSELSIQQINDMDEALGSRIKQMTGNYNVFVKQDKTKNMRTKGNEND